VQDVALVTSQSDDAVSDLVTWRLIGFWRKKGLVRFASVDFPKAMKIEHDMIDPTQKNQRTDIVSRSGKTPERALKVIDPFDLVCIELGLIGWLFPGEPRHRR